MYGAHVALHINWRSAHARPAVGRRIVQPNVPAQPAVEVLSRQQQHQVCKGMTSAAGGRSRGKVRRWHFIASDGCRLCIAGLSAAQGGWRRGARGEGRRRRGGRRRQGNAMHATLLTPTPTNRAPLTPSQLERAHGCVLEREGQVPAQNSSSRAELGMLPATAIACRQRQPGRQPRRAKPRQLSTARRLAACQPFCADVGNTHPFKDGHVVPASNETGLDRPAQKPPRHPAHLCRRQPAVALWDHSATSPHSR